MVKIIKSSGKKCFESSNLNFHHPINDFDNLQKMLFKSKQWFRNTEIGKQERLTITLVQLQKAKLYIYICNKYLAKQPDWDEFSAQNFAHVMNQYDSGCPLPPPKGNLNLQTYI